jgi:hypothetical protein
MEDLSTTVPNEETTEEMFQRLTVNATALEKIAITVLMDPWTYLCWFALFMAPLLFAAVWASSVLLKEQKIREKNARKKRN